MSAIIVQPNTRTSRVVAQPEDFMPISARILVAEKVNALWAEFVNDMHDGELVAPGVAEKFWRYVTR